MIITARTSRLRMSVAIASIAFIAACGRNDRYDLDTSTAAGDVAAPRIDSAAPTSAMSDSLALPTTDAGAVAVVSAIDDSEIEASRLATDRAQSTDVKQFARDMITAHTKHKREVTQLAKSANLSADTGMTRSDTTANIPPKSETARIDSTLPTMSTGILATLQSAHQRTMEQLRSATGAEFDRQYVRAQVAAHTQALDILRRMESSAQNAQLKQNVSQTISVVQGHLDRANQLERTLGGGTTGF
jgi:putative membrane protein